MPRYIALLRGINVGSRNRVAMADLRRLTEALGHTEVATYIQSGNVLFTSPGTDCGRSPTSSSRRSRGVWPCGPPLSCCRELTSRG
jgi:hypothetical protein